ncbi:aminoglycoside phosphotransferase family protein [Amorphoplanes nipponensis]|nr:aminoglycoside phosphotransferase family protein [Actinoplanes nipponensis]
MWKIPSGIVGRVGERGTDDVASKEVEVSRWLRVSGVRATRALDGVAQPTVIDGYPVTWWELLPESRPATPAELGATLRRLHDLPDPRRLSLPRFSPFEAARKHLKSVEIPKSEDMIWVLNRMLEVEQRCEDILPGLPTSVIHGDAWQGNFAVIDSQDPVILDLEAFCVGPELWDLIAIAVDFTDFARIPKSEYEGFAAAYHFDVITSPAYLLLAEVQELRWTAYVIGKSKPGSAAESEAAHRVACLKGEVSRPWKWAPF